MPDRYDPTTGLHILDKTVDESILFDCNLSRRMRAADTIASVTSVEADNRGLVSGSDDVSVGEGTSSGTTAQVRVSGGTADEEYIITFTVLTAGGDTVTGSGLLQVRAV